MANQRLVYGIHAHINCGARVLFARSTFGNAHRANSCDYARGIKREKACAALEAKPYSGGPNAVPVQWLFEGLTELLPIYGKLEDGAEIMYREINPTKLKNLRKMIRQKDDFSR